MNLGCPKKRIVIFISMMEPLIIGSNIYGSNINICNVRDVSVGNNSGEENSTAGLKPAFLKMFKSMK